MHYYDQSHKIGEESADRRPQATKTSEHLTNRVDPLRLPNPVHLDAETLSFMHRTLGRQPSDLWSDLFTALMGPAGTLDQGRYQDLIRTLFASGALHLPKIASAWTNSPAATLLSIDESLKQSGTLHHDPAAARRLLALRLQECACCTPQHDWVLNPSYLAPSFANYHFQRDSSHALHRTLALSLMLHPSEVPFTTFDREDQASSLPRSTRYFLAELLGKYEELDKDCRHKYLRCFELLQTVNTEKLNQLNLESFLQLLEPESLKLNVKDSIRHILARLDFSIICLKAQTGNDSRVRLGIGVGIAIGAGVALTEGGFILGCFLMPMDLSFQHPASLAMGLLAGIALGLWGRQTNTIYHERLKFMEKLLASTTELFCATGTVLNTSLEIDKK